MDYSFLFMRADGEQLGRITSLVEAAGLRPILDRVFPFEAANDAFAHFETGRSKGKVVVKVKSGRVGPSAHEASRRRAPFSMISIIQKSDDGPGGSRWTHLRLQEAHRTLIA